MFGWLFPAMLKSSMFGWLLYNSLYRETDVTYNHLILDDFVHPILEVAFSFHYWMFLVISFWMKSICYHYHPQPVHSCWLRSHWSSKQKLLSASEGELSVVKWRFFPAAQVLMYNCQAAESKARCLPINIDRGWVHHCSRERWLLYSCLRCWYSA